MDFFGLRKPRADVIAHRRHRYIRAEIEKSHSDNKRDGRNEKNNHFFRRERDKRREIYHKNEERHGQNRHRRFF